MALYTLCRILFYLFNMGYFSDVGFTVFLGGLRFDLAAVVILNLPVILLHLLPFPFREKPGYKKLLQWVFLLVNIPGLALSVIDMEYFKFTFKRSTADLFNLMGMGQDLQNLIPIFLRDYWYLVILFLIFCYGLYRFDPGRKKTVPRHSPFSLAYLLQHTLILLFFAGISVIAIRGGFQLKPINMVHAGIYSSANNVPLVLNTPFTIIKTLNNQGLEMKNYFPEKELNRVYNPVHHPAPSKVKHQVPEKKNIVLIVLESFSQDYIGALSKGTSYTPFLDSLIGESLVFENAFANGKKSIEAIPAVTASIPALMTDPFISSNYSGNDINSLATCLKEMGYNSSFYHGGYNGTMGFEPFTQLAGFDGYYGFDQYPDPSHSDDAWGIWDEEYLQYFVEQLDRKDKPFFSTVMTLSSHHPFKVPEQYEGNFKKGSLKIHKTIEYTDLALRKFFQTVRKKEWYENTLFVITADHTSAASKPYYNNSIGMYSIPLLFFDPDGSLPRERRFKVAQQTDIMPSILDLVGYEKPYVAFGKSLFRKGNGPFYNYTYLNATYQLIGNSYALRFDGEKSISLYNHEKNPELKNILLENDSIKARPMERKVKAIIQQFNNRMIENRLTAP